MGAARGVPRQLRSRGCSCGLRRSRTHPEEESATVTDHRYNEVRNAMQALVNASLVEWDESNGRFRLHDLVRQFCEGKLSEEERTAARLRHASHFNEGGLQSRCAFLRKVSKSQNVVRGLAIFDRERTQIEAAFQWLVQQPNETTATVLNRFVNATAQTTALRFPPSQRIEWFERQLAAARSICNRHSELSALGNLGLAYADLSDTHKAIEHYVAALLIAREIGDRPRCGVCSSRSRQRLSNFRRYAKRDCSPQTESTYRPGEWRTPPRRRYSRQSRY